MTDIRKLYIILCGYEVIRKSGCLRDAPRHIVMTVPICCYLLETAQGFAMYDAGLGSRRLGDPAASAAHFVNDTFPGPPIVLPEHEVLPQLQALGVAPGDIRTIVLSHVHGDHVGHLTDFPNAEILIQRVEHDAAFSDKGRRQKGFEDIASPDLNWRIVEGDVQVMPGLDLIYTPGHSAGHQSAVVALPSGDRKILTGDVADLLENYEREVLGNAIDDAAALDSIRRLNALAEDPRAQLVPLHDPGFVERAVLAPGFYS